MRTLSLGPLIAKGRTAEVYALQENQILKLYYAWCSPDWVQQEIDVGRVIATMPLPTPKLIDALKIEERQGIIYERADGPSLLTLSSTKPWLVLHLARQLAELHAQIHKQDGSSFPPLHSALYATIQRMENLSSSLKTDLLRVVEKLPDGNALCHCDFHPDQVLITTKGPVIIDWPTAHRGHPLADVARTSILLMIGQVPYANWAMQASINLWRWFFYRTYVARYLELHPGVTREDITTWMIPVAAARLDERIQGEQKPLLRFIQSHLPL
jgi:hypothetical protein